MPGTSSATEPEFGVALRPGPLMAEKAGPSPTGQRQVTSAGPGDVRERPLKSPLPTKEPSRFSGGESPAPLSVG